MSEVAPITSRPARTPEEIQEMEVIRAGLLALQRSLVPVQVRVTGGKGGALVERLSFTYDTNTGAYAKIEIDFRKLGL